MKTIVVMGKIGMEIGKLVALWMGVCPWLSELMEYDWDMDETLVGVIMVAMVTVAGHLAINRMKAAIAELRYEKIERKNSKKRGANKASSLFFLC